MGVLDHLHFDHEPFRTPAATAIQLYINVSHYVAILAYIQCFRSFILMELILCGLVRTHYCNSITRALSSRELCD